MLPAREGVIDGCRVPLGPAVSCRERRGQVAGPLEVNLPRFNGEGVLKTEISRVEGAIELCLRMSVDIPLTLGERAFGMNGTTCLSG